MQCYPCVQLHRGLPCHAAATITAAAAAAVEAAAAAAAAALRSWIHFDNDKGKQLERQPGNAKVVVSFHTSLDLEDH